MAEIILSSLLKQTQISSSTPVNRGLNEDFADGSNSLSPSLDCDIPCCDGSTVTNKEEELTKTTTTTATTPNSLDKPIRAISFSKSTRRHSMVSELSIHMQPEDEQRMNESKPVTLSQELPEELPTAEEQHCFANWIKARRRLSQSNDSANDIQKQLINGDLLTDGLQPAKIDRRRRRRSSWNGSNEGNSSFRKETMEMSDYPVNVVSVREMERRASIFSTITMTNEWEAESLRSSLHSSRRKLSLDHDLQDSTSTFNESTSTFRDGSLKQEDNQEDQAGALPVFEQQNTLQGNTAGIINETIELMSYTGDEILTFSGDDVLNTTATGLLNTISFPKHKTPSCISGVTHGSSLRTGTGNDSFSSLRKSSFSRNISAKDDNFDDSFRNRVTICSDRENEEVQQYKWEPDMTPVISTLMSSSADDDENGEAEEKNNAQDQEAIDYEIEEWECHNGDNISQEEEKDFAPIVSVQKTRRGSMVSELSLNDSLHSLGRFDLNTISQEELPPPILNTNNIGRRGSIGSVRKNNSSSIPKRDRKDKSRSPLRSSERNARVSKSPTRERKSSRKLPPIEKCESTYSDEGSSDGLVKMEDYLPRRRRKASILAQDDRPSQAVKRKTDTLPLSQQIQEEVKKQSGDKDAPSLAQDESDQQQSRTDVVAMSHQLKQLRHQPSSKTMSLLSETSSRAISIRSGTSKRSFARGDDTSVASSDRESLLPPMRKFVYAKNPYHKSSSISERSHITTSTDLTTSDFSWNNSSSEMSSDLSRQVHRNSSSLISSFAYAGKPKEEEEDHDEDGQLKRQSRPMIPKRNLSPIPPDEDISLPKRRTMSKGPTRKKEDNTEDTVSALQERILSVSSDERDIATNSHDTKSSSLQQVSSFDSTTSTKRRKKKKTNADIRRQKSDMCATDVPVADHHTNPRNEKGRRKTLIGRLRASLWRSNKKNSKVCKREKQ